MFDNLCLQHSTEVAAVAAAACTHERALHYTSRARWFRWRTCKAGMTAGCAQNLVLFRSNVSGGTQAASFGAAPFGTAVTGSMAGPPLAPVLHSHMQSSVGYVKHHSRQETINLQLGVLAPRGLPLLGLKDTGGLSPLRLLPRRVIHTASGSGTSLRRCSYASLRPTYDDVRHLRLGDQRWRAAAAAAHISSIRPADAQLGSGPRLASGSLSIR